MQLWSLISVTSRAIPPRELLRAPIYTFITPTSSIASKSTPNEKRSTTYRGRGYASGDEHGRHDVKVHAALLKFPSELELIGLHETTLKVGRVEYNIFTPYSVVGWARAAPRRRARKARPRRL